MKWYLLPDDPQPEGTGCMLVFYPDDEMYRRALLGSLHFLGTWVAWEKDGTNRAALAAMAWKDANDRTCEMADCLDELISSINDLKSSLEGIRVSVDGVRYAMIAHGTEDELGDVINVLTLLAGSVESVDTVMGGG